MFSSWGKKIGYSLFGESHGKGVGITIHGLEAGIKIPYNFIDKMLESRKTGLDFVSSRKEPDFYEILSGVTNNHTNGSPLTFFIPNKDYRVKDYSDFKIKPRPSHSDYVNLVKNGEFAEISGSGHFSARLTAPIVIAGAIIINELKKENILVASRIKSAYDIVDNSEFLACDIDKLHSDKVQVLDEDKKKLILDLVRKVKDSGDTIGSEIETKIFNVPVGIGSPFFYSVESVLSSLLFSVPAVKSVSFGIGENFRDKMGSEVNDEFYFENEKIKTKTNNSGGINAGITNGMDIIINSVLRPAASILKKQNTINLESKRNDVIKINGRHDPLIAIRACPVIESIVAMGIYELMEN